MPQFREDEDENTKFERMMQGLPEQSGSRQESDDDEVSSIEEFEGATTDNVKASLVNPRDSIQEEWTWSSCGPYVSILRHLGFISKAAMLSAFRCP